MTVLELINELLHLPPAAKVFVSEFQGCPGSEAVEVLSTMNESDTIEIDIYGDS